MDTFRLDHWSPELRRAVMRVRPEFFSWPAAQQERYGAAMPRADRHALDEALMAELFGRRSASRKATETVASRISLDQQHRFNESVLPLLGIGADSFFLNEGFADGKSLLDFSTVRDYDEDDHRFQEQARKNDDLTHAAGVPYIGSLHSRWARLFVDGRFTYATLSMAANYLTDRLSEIGDKLLSERIPHRYVEGKHHGEVEGNQWRWDMRIDAGGKEGILEELQHRIWNYQRVRHDGLLLEWDRRNLGGVYLLEESLADEAHCQFVFTDKDAMAAVRFSSFLKDCRALQRSPRELFDALDLECTRLARYVETQHAEVERTYDPKVRKLRRKRKVMMAKGAFDQLK